jgi:hypothetical protein
MSVPVDARPGLPISIDRESLILGAAGEALYTEINACCDDGHLDNIASSIWYVRGQDQLTDAAAEYLQHCVIRRRSTSGMSHPVTATIQRLAGRLSSRFKPRKSPRSHDRKASRDRRRMLGGSSALPDRMRHCYTEGNRAVLFIVAAEIKQHGFCDLPIDKIAALAGVCRTSVQNALHEAQRLRHIRIAERPRPGRKHLTNIVEIVAPESIAWIKRRPAAARTMGSKAVKKVNTTKSKYKKKEAQQDCQPSNGSRRPNERQPGQIE